MAWTRRCEDVTDMARTQIQDIKSEVSDLIQYNTMSILKHPGIITEYWQSRMLLGAGLKFTGIVVKNYTVIFNREEALR